jgi:hypothetical protein
MAMIRLSLMVGTAVCPGYPRSVLTRPFDCRTADHASMEKKVQPSTWRDPRYFRLFVRRRETGLVAVGIITAAQMIGSLAVRHTLLSLFRSLTYLILSILSGSSFCTILLGHVRSTGHYGCWSSLDARWCNITSSRINGRPFYWSTSAQ